MNEAQAQLKFLLQQVRALHDAEEVVGFGPFLYVYMARVSLKSFRISGLLYFSHLDAFCPSTLEFSSVASLPKSSIRPPYSEISPHLKVDFLPKNGSGLFPKENNSYLHHISKVRFLFVGQGRKRIVKKMPLVLCMDSTTEENHICLIGIPPLQGDDDRKYVPKRIISYEL